MELKFSTVRERDMDLLFLEAMSSDQNFARLIVDKTKIAGSDFEVISIELSRTDTDLGESDITVILSVDNSKFAILLEDKIDAAAMTEQHERYIKRGTKGVKAGEYSDFDIIMICPEKYYINNLEAKLYEHHIFYEELEEYFKSCTDPTSKVRLLQVQAAINKAKKTPEIILNEAANSFFQCYRDHQKKYYPQLDLRTKESSNGWWAHYSTGLGQVYIYHKMQEGYVDLTFPNAAEHMDTMQEIASWLRDNRNHQITAVKTGRSSALRIECPKLKVKEHFRETSPDDLKACFDAIKSLSELAAVFAKAERMSNLTKN